MSNRLALILLALLWNQAQLQAADSDIKVSRVARGSIVVDGKDGDSGWSEATTNKLNFSIIDDGEPEVKTTYQIVYDDEAIYVKMIAFDDDISGLRRKFTKRDDFEDNKDDMMWIVIDPTGEKKFTQFFGVNAACSVFDGVYNDLTYYMDLAPQYDFDAQCSEGDNYWMAELRIPFAELKYTSTPAPMTFLVQRKLLRTQSILVGSSDYDFYGTCILCNAKPLMMESPPKVTRFKWTAEAFAGQSQVDGVFKNRFDLGLTAEIPLSQGTTLDATIHPDYSQVEADEPYLTANAAFPTAQTENRPFFLESGEVLHTPLFSTAASRSIVAPDFGAKIISRGDRYSFILLAASDRESNFRIVPGTYYASYEKARDKSTNILSHGSFNVNDDTNVGLSLNIKDEQGLHQNAVIGPEFSTRISSSHKIFGQVLFSESLDREVVDQDERGPRHLKSDNAAGLGYEWTLDRGYVALSGKRLGTDFANDLSFMSINGVQIGDASFEYATGLKSESLLLSDLVFMGSSRRVEDVRNGQVVSSATEASLEYRTDKWLTIRTTLAPVADDRVSSEGNLHEGHKQILTLTLQPPLYISLLECQLQTGTLTVFPEDALGKNRKTSCRLNVNLGLHASAEYYQATDHYRVMENGHELREKINTGSMRYWFNRDNFCRLTWQHVATDTFDGTSYETTSTLLFGHQAVRGLSLYMGASRATSSVDLTDGTHEYFVKTAWSL